MSGYIETVRRGRIDAVNAQAEFDPHELMEFARKAAELDARVRIVGVITAGPHCGLTFEKRVNE